MFTRRTGIPISRRKKLSVTGLAVLTLAIAAAAVFFFVSNGTTGACAGGTWCSVR